MGTIYVVRGVMADGTPVSERIEAGTLGEAEELASGKGITVTAISRADAAKKPSPTATSRTPTPTPAIPDPSDAVQGAEVELWSDTPSHWPNFWIYLLGLLVLPLPWSIYAFFKTKTTKLTLTSQRLRIRTGILSTTLEEIELYRVRDTAMTQSFIQRVAGLGTVTMETTDTSMPHVAIEHVSKPMELRETIRKAVERVRRVQRVREIEMT